MVDQSDWLPMMMATGFAAMTALGVVRGEKEGADYRNRLRGGKPNPPMRSNVSPESHKITGAGEK
jgi:hypothetical protein